MKWLGIGVAIIWPLALGQDPPVPTLHPDYSEEARLARLEGRAEVEYSLNYDGTPRGMRVSHSLGLGLDEKALETVRQMLQPGPKTGHRVYADFSLPPESRWHLIGAHFLVTEGATRPTFASTSYPPGTGITVHAFDEGRLVGTMGREAYVRLVIDIDEHGVPVNFRVLNASLDLWGDEAIALVSPWRFNPGKKGNESVVVPCILDLAWGPRDLPIETLEKVRLAMNESGQGAIQPTPTLVYSPKPPYTPEARAAHLEGSVIISLVVGTDGSPKNLTVSKSLGMGLDESALQIVSTWQFQVPLVNGRPTEVPTVVRVYFRLDGK